MQLHDLKPNEGSKKDRRTVEDLAAPENIRARHQSKPRSGGGVECTPGRHLPIFRRRPKW